MCHATGRDYWDIPKGLLDPGETPLAAALRELHEETALELAATDVRDLGVHVYLSGKDLHLFVVDPPLPTLATEQCRCSTTYRWRGRDVPEVDAYRQVSVATGSKLVFVARQVA